MDIQVVGVLILAHVVGDGPLQSFFGFRTEFADGLATRKHHDWLALYMHVMIYSCALLTAGFWLIDGPSELPRMSLWWAVNTVAHYFTDAVTSRVNAWNFLAGRRHWFFNGVVADQGIHYFTLVLTASWWLP